jgi:hypothetical protein
VAFPAGGALFNYKGAVHIEGSRFLGNTAAVVGAICRSPKTTLNRIFLRFLY